LFICVTFERYVTNLRGTFVPVPISTHPTAYRRAKNVKTIRAFFVMDIQMPIGILP
jgi:hypothetical protein